jgi:hypothetical protein
MVETVQVKIEGDNPNLDSPTQNQTSPHDTPTSNNDSGAATSETVELNNLLSGKQFLDKLCLATVQGKHAGRSFTFRWPAIHYSNKKQFLEDILESISRSAYIKFAKYLTQHPLKGDNTSRGCGTAFLLGMPTIEDSLITLGEGMVEKYEDHIDELLKDDDYKDNEMFKKAVEIADRRVAELDFDPSNEDEDDKDDEGTVAFDSGSTPPSLSYSNQARAGACTSPENQTGVSTSSTDQDNVEVIAIEDTPPAKSGGKGNKRKGKSKDGTGTASKKKKTPKQTPKSKTRGTQPPMVTPLPTKSSDKDVSNNLRDFHISHKLPTNDAAWNILKAKFGISCKDGKFYLPHTSDSEDVKPVATSLMGLRKDLCAKGLPESIQPLSEEEKIDIARWVRYTYVKGLEDGQEINPDDLGEHIPSKFMDEGAWPLLRDKFGCSWNGTYKVPLTPNGEETKTFETTSGVDGHFARFGIQCIPDDPGDNILSQKARLSIELFFATPSFEVLNTL